MAAWFSFRHRNSGVVLYAVLLGCLSPVGAGSADAGPLAVVRAMLHQYEGGPPISSSFEFFPGDTVFLSFRIAGYHLSDEDELHLGYRVEALDPAGVRLQKPATGTILTQLRWQDKKKHWMPIVRYHVLVPPAAPSGDYRFVMTVNDVLANSRTHAETRFRVRGQQVAPSDTLVIRNFRFLRSGTALQALSPAAYRPGDSVWARFEITGYKFGEKNRFSIDYGIKVLRASGKLLFEQPVAATEERESYYPQRHIPGSLSLKLTRDLAKGAYTIIVTVHDHIGGQTYQTKQVFTVE